jgi:hypothetical protein
MGLCADAYYEHKSFIGAKVGRKTSPGTSTRLTRELIICEFSSSELQNGATSEPVTKD